MLLAACRFLSRQTSDKARAVPDFESWVELEIIARLRNGARILVLGPLIRDRKTEGDRVFDAVRKHYSEREVVELTVLCGTYIMHNRVFTALRVDLEPKKS